MTLVSKRTMGFSTSSLLKRKEPHAFHYFSERITFWIAVVSLFAFVTGNMVGQHGWHVFWKSVLGQSDDSLITFTGTVSPLKEVPDYTAWARLGGDYHLHTFRQVPKDVLRPLPPYTPGDVSQAAGNTYFVDHLGTYETGRGHGAHPGIDIAAPIGTPVQSIANGIVTRVDTDAGGYGKFIVIKHPNAPHPTSKHVTTSVFSIYAHLSETLVSEGTVVHKGDQIALTGQTGFATGPHLHFQMDLASAPSHPYWPFTSSEARAAGLSFSKAVDAGLHRERGLEHTTNPLLYVQAFESFTPTTRVVQSSSRSASSKMSRQESIAARRAKRETILAQRSAVLAAQATPPQAPAAAQSSASQAPVIVSTETLAIDTPAPVPVASSSAAPAELTSVRVRHDGTYGRSDESVTIILLDSGQNVIKNPSFPYSLYIRDSFGQATFQPSVLNADQFQAGVATVRMIPAGKSQKTVIINVIAPGGKVLNNLSETKPLTYER